MEPFNQALQGFQGLRRVKIKRTENGFGFTLRHFIVYPPDSSFDNDEQNQREIKLVKITEPVDTIFVKSIVKNGPADNILCLGDRIVSVNGVPIKSYEQVISQIQTCLEPYLYLEVSPKQFDTLQLFYEEKAHRPETNQRPIILPNPQFIHNNHIIYQQQKQQQGPLIHYNHQNQKSTIHNPNTTTNKRHFYPKAYNSYESVFQHLPSKNKLQLVMSSPPDQQQQQHQQHQQQHLFSHLPRPTPYKGNISNISWSHLSSAPGQHSKLYQPYPQPQSYYPFQVSHFTNTTTNTNGPSTSSSVVNNNNVVVINDGVGVQSVGRFGSMENMIIPGTGIDTLSSNNGVNAWKNAGPGYRFSISTTGSGSTNELMEPLRVSSMSNHSQGQGQGQPEPLDSDGIYAGRLSNPSISPSKGGYDVKMADRIRKSCEQKEAFLRRPNQPLVWAPVQTLPAVPKELYVQPQKFAKVPWPPDQIQMKGLVSQLQQPENNVNSNRVCVSESRTLSNSPGSSASRTNGLDVMRNYSSLDETNNSNNVKSWGPPVLSDYLPCKNRVTVVGSGKLHCDPPADWNPQNQNNNTQETELQVQNRNANGVGGDGEGIASTSIINIKSMESGQEKFKNGRKRPNYLPLPVPNIVPKSNYKIAEISKQEQMTQSAQIDKVILRRRESDPEFDNDRLVRRVSYLKATSSPIEMERKGSSPTNPNKSPSSEFRHFGQRRSDKSPDTSMIVREGLVQFKIRSSGDSTKKSGQHRSWKQRFAQIRRSGMLYLTKERIPKDLPISADDPNISFSIGLKADGLSIESADDYTKRKNVFRIKYSGLIAEQSSAASLEILVQAEDLSDLHQWLSAIHSQQDNNNYSNNQDNTPKSSLQALRSVRAPNNNTNNNSSSVQQQQFQTSSSTSSTVPPTFLNINSNSGHLATSPKNKTWKGKFSKQWKKIQLSTGNSPSSPLGSNYNPNGTIQESGATFGVPLDECPPGLKNPKIPRVVEYCIDVIDERGLEVQGVYRIPGNNATISALTELLNKGNEPNPDEDPRWRDIHVLGSLLKSFLRSIPDPILTEERYPEFIRACDELDEKKRFDRIQELINELPESHYETLKVMSHHIRRMADNHQKNRMDSKNLAIIFGPTLVKTNNTASSMADMKQSCLMVELLINHAYEFFPRDDDDGQEQQNNIVKNNNLIPTPTNQQQSVPVLTSPIKIPNDIRASLIQAAQRKVLKQNSQTGNSSAISPSVPHNTYGLPNTPPFQRIGGPAVTQVNTTTTTNAIDESGHIRSYSGLGAETEQRVKQFELETRAMLYRDGRGQLPNQNLKSPHLVQTSSEIANNNQLRMNILRLEQELRKAKDDMENEDYYDQIADNPSSIVHHRLALYPVVQNLSSSSISSTNSNSNSGGPTGPIGQIYPSTTWPMRLGPTPFKSAFPSLPPKPPAIKQNSVPVNSLSGGYNNISNKNNSSSRPTDLPDLKRVNSSEKILSSNFERDKGILLRKYSQPESAFPQGQQGHKIFGSLDSLREVGNGLSTTGTGGSEMLIKMIGSQDQDDLSPRSSDGSDSLVTSLSKTLDKKLQKLHDSSGRQLQLQNQHQHQQREFLSLQYDQNPQDHQEKIEFSSLPPNVSSTNNSIYATVAPRNAPGVLHLNGGFIKDKDKLSEKRRRNSYIDQPPKFTLSPIEPPPGSEFYSREQQKQKQSEKQKEQDFEQKTQKVKVVYRDPLKHRFHVNGHDGQDACQKEQLKLTLSNESNKKANRSSKDCKRRHSLSGAADIFRFVFDTSGEKARNSKNLSSETLTSNLTSNNILESHV